MRLEDQVCSLHLAKRLKDLNVKQNGYFYWTPVYLKSLKPEEWKLEILYYDLSSLPDWCYSAFTVAELLEMLPAFINQYDLVVKKCSTEYEVKYCSSNDEQRLAISWDGNIANALACMVIEQKSMGAMKND